MVIAGSKSEAGDRRLRPPRNQPEAIRMLALYDDATGLDGLLAKFDFSGVAPWALDRIILGQPTREPRPPADLDPAEHAKALLQSSTFRQFILRSLLDAFPEKQRVLFVHVPKCAGSDLTAALRERYFNIDGAIENQGWYTPEQRLKYIRELVLASDFVDALFVRGHVPLRFYVNQALIRPGDQVFTVLREPTDVIISMVNYVLTRFRGDPAGHRPDTRAWFANLGLRQLPDNLTRDGWLALAGRVMRNKHIVTDNVLCNALGRGDAASALENLITSDIEITDLPRYEPWLTARWGIPASKRLNESIKFITRDSLQPEDRDHIRAKVTEDEVLYQAVTRGLDASGQTSIRGRALG